MGGCTPLHICLPKHKNSRKLVFQQDAFISRAAHYAKLFGSHDVFVNELATCRFREFGNWPDWKGQGSPLQIAAKLGLTDGMNFYDLFAVALVVGSLCDSYVIFNYSRLLGRQVIGKMLN